MKYILNSLLRITCAQATYIAVWYVVASSFDREVLMEPSPAILGRQDIRGSVEITVSKNSKWHMIILHVLTLLSGGQGGKAGNNLKVSVKCSSFLLNSRRFLNLDLNFFPLKPSHFDERPDLVLSPLEWVEQSTAPHF